MSEELSEAELAELRERFKNWSNLAYNITSKEGMRLLATLDRATERAEKAEGELRKWTDGRGICVLNTFPHRKQNACVGWHAVAHPEAD